MTGRHRRTWMTVLLAGQVVVSVLLAVALFRDHGWALSDVTLYSQWSGLILDGRVPYRDFSVDYPPLALLPMLVPRLVTGFADITYGTYVAAFGGLMAVLSLALSAAVARLEAGAATESPWRARLRYIGLMVISLPLLLIRFELWPILLTAVALLAAIRRQPVLSGALLGLAIAAKLYPVLLVPILAAGFWRTGGRRDALRLIGAAVVATALALLPFALLAGWELVDVISFQQGRGLQVESAAGAFFQLLNLVAPEHLEVVHVTTYELESDRVAEYLVVQPLIGAGLVAAVLGYAVLRVARGMTGASAWHDAARACMAVLIVFMLTNRVLSPQHLMWLLPFTFVLAGARYVVLLAALVATMLVFPVLYDELLRQDPLPILLVNLRNVLLGLLAVALLLVRDRSAAREPAAGPAAA